MIISTVILGWIGIFIFFIISFTFKKLINNNESAFLHMLFALMYAMWFPVPFALYQLLNSKILQIGTLFGFVYLLMLVITMTLQSGHISYLVKHNENKSITTNQANYMMATLANPFEGLANVFKSIWALFIGITLWNNGEIFMSNIMFSFAILIFYYLFMILNTSLIKRIKFLSKVRANIFLTNIETLVFFLVLICYMTIKV